MEFWLGKDRSDDMKQGDRKFSAVGTMDLRSQRAEGFLELGYVIGRIIPPIIPIPRCPHPNPWNMLGYLAKGD